MLAMTDREINWPPPPARWALGAGEVHVWAAALDRTAKQLSCLEQTLSADELARSRRFHFEQDRQRFVAGRGFLRAILGHYLRSEPARLEFQYTSQGKPWLTESVGEPQLHFNVAHSAGLAVFALTQLCPVGVDIELVRAIHDAEQIAVRFFSAGESKGLNALPASERVAAFFNLWTRKEAWLKATGEGIGNSLSQVEVSFLAGDPVRVIGLFGDSQACTEWSLHELAPAGKFAGALALPKRDAEISCWRWTE